MPQTAIADSEPSVKNPDIHYKDHIKEIHGANPFYDPAQDQRLWKGVIIQAFEDALVDEHAGAAWKTQKSGSELLEWPTAVRDARDAIKWLLFPTSESRLVTALAGVTTPVMHKAALKKLTPVAALYEQLGARWSHAAATAADGKAMERASAISEAYFATAKLIRDGEKAQ